ncbi:DUF6056 family protein [Hymenobacter actinosclerus]|nr:DUF6056 family protein [Hymenobacter actinosclerus]
MTRTFLRQRLELASRQLIRLITAPAAEWLMLCLCLLPFLLISAFNHPTDDDFQAAVLARRYSFWQSIQFYYQHWTGRYTSSFLYGLVYEAPSLDCWLLALRLAPIALLLALVSALYFAIGGLGYTFSASLKGRLSLYGTLLYLCGTPLVASALYWYNGAAVYTSGLVLGLVLIGLIGRSIQTTHRIRQAGWGIGAAISGVLLVGTNELMIPVALGGVILWMLAQTKKNSIWPVVVLVASGLGAAVAIAAPGNFARADKVQAGLPFVYRAGIIGGKSLYLTASHLAAWVSNGALLAATILFLWWLQPRQRVGVPSRWLGAAIAGAVGMVLLTIPTLWATNDVPARVWNVVYFLFLLCWFALVAAAASQWALPVSWRVSRRAGRGARVVWLAFLVAGYSSAVHVAYVDLAFKAPQYHKAQLQRYALLGRLRQAGQLSASVPALLPNEYQYPATLFLHELEPFPQDIANEGVAAYFGLDSVRIKAPPARSRRHMFE